MSNIQNNIQVYVNLLLLEQIQFDTLLQTLY